MKEVIEKEAIVDSYKVCKIVPAGLSEDLGDIAALSLATLSDPVFSKQNFLQTSL